MTAERVSRPRPWVGCVTGTETGVCRVLTDRGELRASFGGGMLGLLARDRSCAPQPGDWVVLRGWPDERVTIEAPWARRPPAKVIPIRRATR